MLLQPWLIGRQTPIRNISFQVCMSHTCRCTVSLLLRNQYPMILRPQYRCPLNSLSIEINGMPSDRRLAGTMRTVRSERAKLFSHNVLAEILGIIVATTFPSIFFVNPHRFQLQLNRCFQVERCSIRQCRRLDVLFQWNVCISVYGRCHNISTRCVRWIFATQNVRLQFNRASICGPTRLFVIVEFFISYTCCCGIVIQSSHLDVTKMCRVLREYGRPLLSTFKGRHS
mmetsp:Transcript_20039/g.43167  ORF Transcript_20039/g.43167 Transcript_20039/m.43167 type:complete len:228 (+) Transcript_20039:1231-1914(+)